MDNIKTREDIKKELNTYKNKYVELVEGWEKVTRVYKKDGKPFKITGKNFTNCYITIKNYGLKSCKEEQLTIYTKNYSDNIDLIQLVKYCKFKPKEDRIINEPWLEPYFYINVDELEELIKDRIILFKGYIQEYETLLNNVDFYCNMLDPLINKINVIIKDSKKLNNGNKYSNGLMYDLMYYTTNNIKSW